MTTSEPPLEYFQAFGTRQPDSRVAAAVAERLPEPGGRPIVDLGAGTGGYASLLAHRGHSIVLVDSSPIQLAAAPPYFRSVTADASHLPLESGEADGCYAILALHQFGRLKESLDEAARVTDRRAFCAVTFDRRFGSRLWVAEYFPDAWFAAYSHFPTIDEQVTLISESFGRRATVDPFPIPRSFRDSWLAAGWDDPSLYLSHTFRARNSSFHRARADLTEAGVARLAEDLKSGAWDARYGSQVNEPSVEAGYFIVSVP